MVHVLTQIFTQFLQSPTALLLFKTGKSHNE